MKKLYLVTKIDAEDNVSRDYVTAPSRRDKVFKNPDIVKVEEQSLPIKDIELALRKARIPEHVVKHIIFDLTNK